MPVPAESDTTKQPSTGGAGASPATPPAPTSASVHNGDTTSLPVAVENSAARSNGGPSNSGSPPPLQQEQQQPQSAQQDGATPAGERPL